MEEEVCGPGRDTRWDRREPAGWGCSCVEGTGGGREGEGEREVAMRRGGAKEEGEGRPWVGVEQGVDLI